jgi:hypothetical protein
MKKKNNENKIINKKDISLEPAQVQIARLFYRMIDIISNDVIKDDNVCEEAKSAIFSSSMISFDELSYKEQESYIIAANAGWCAGMSVLKTLLDLNEDKENNKNKEGDK